MIPFIFEWDYTMWIRSICIVDIISLAEKSTRVSTLLVLEKIDTIGELHESCTHDISMEIISKI